jgi:hypothetical protein
VHPARRSGRIEGGITAPGGKTGTFMGEFGISLLRDAL